MKKTTLFLSLILSISATAQKKATWEYSANLQSGLFRFSGNGAAKYTGYYIADVGQNSTVTYYGRKPGFSYTVEGAVKLVSRKKWIGGSSLAYESLQSKVDITSVTSMMGTNFATGTSKLKTQFITYTGFIGKRLTCKKVDIDITAGGELGFSLKTTEKVDYTMDIGGGENYERDRQKPGTDIRLRFQVTAYYKKWGILAGYSLGGTNYYGQLIGADPEAFSRFLRLGLSYRFK